MWNCRPFETESKISAGWSLGSNYKVMLWYKKKVPGRHKKKTWKRKNIDWKRVSEKQHDRRGGGQDRCREEWQHVEEMCGGGGGRGDTDQHTRETNTSASSKVWADFKAKWMLRLMPPGGGINNNHAEKGDQMYKAGKRKWKRSKINLKGVSGFSGEQRGVRSQESKRMRETQIWKWKYSRTSLQTKFLYRGKKKYHNQ